MKRISFFLLLFLGTIFLSAQVPRSPLLSSFEEYKVMKNKTEYALEWISLGPVVNSARVEAVQLDPTHPGTLYAAFGSGNLWKSTNNGNHWKPIFEDQAALGIGDIALAPSDPNILYVGTGESLKKARNFTMPGTGVYRSDNAGESWKHMGLEDSWHIGEIVVHPNNPDIVLVAVMGHFWSTNPHRGIYRSENGGKSWQHVLYIDDKTAANDIVISPSNPDVVYASMWENNPGIQGPNSGIFISKDGGKTWERRQNGLPEGNQTGRIGLAVSYQNPLTAYALLDNLNKDKRQSAEIYKTVNGGNSWEKTHEQDLLFFPGIGWYFTDIYVSPKDDKEIFALGVKLAHSADGGKTFEYLGGDVFHMYPSAADHLHLDHCELWINPKNPQHLVLGNDGGIYQSFDKGLSWFHFNNIPAGEFYQIALSPDDSYKILAGTQDDATVMGPPREWNPAFAGSWKYLWIDAWSGGDGCYSHIDPKEPNTVYFSMQHGAIRRRDLRTGKSVSIQPLLPTAHAGKLEFNFVAPYILSPHESRTIYAGGNYLMQSLDRGDNWQVISPNLALSQHADKQSVGAGAIAESHLRKGLLYVGTDRGAFWVSKNNGENWVEHSLELPNAYIRSIYPSRHHESRVYISLNGMNYDDLNAYVYVSENNGKSWTNLMEGLPNETANVLIEDPFYEDILYAGMYRGVYISHDRGNSWSLLGKNLPAVAIADMKIQEATRDLVVATHGRGIYKVNLIPIHQKLATDLSRESSMLFEPPKAMRPRFRDTHHDPDYSTLQKVVFSYYVPETQEVELSIRSKENETIWTKSLKASKGYNQYKWDLVFSRKSSLNPYHIHFDNFISQGDYTLVLRSEGGIQEQDFQVLNYSHEN